MKGSDWRGSSAHRGSGALAATVLPGMDEIGPRRERRPRCLPEGQRRSQPGAVCRPCVRLRAPRSPASRPGGRSHRGPVVSSLGMAPCPLEEFIQGDADTDRVLLPVVIDHVFPVAGNGLSIAAQGAADGRRGRGELGGALLDVEVSAAYEREAAPPPLDNLLVTRRLPPSVKRTPTARSADSQGASAQPGPRRVAADKNHQTACRASGAANIITGSGRRQGKVQIRSWCCAPLRLA